MLALLSSLRRLLLTSPLMSPPKVQLLAPSPPKVLAPVLLLVLL